MNNNNLKGWLYLLPAIVFLGFFMVYPLIDVFIYSFEEGYNFASQSYSGTGLFNYSFVLHDPYFMQALKNTILMVIITVPLSTGFALLISLALSSIKPLRNAFQTIYFLPYVTNTLAVGLVFMILFKKTPYSDGLANMLISLFGGTSVDFIEGPYWAKMFVFCFYIIWVVLPFKILILTSAIASVKSASFGLSCRSKPCAYPMKRGKYRLTRSSVLSTIAAIGIGLPNCAAVDSSFPLSQCWPSWISILTAVLFLKRSKS